MRFLLRSRLDCLRPTAGSRARVVADGVAYAPHLPIDVKAWGVDWYGFSVYKTWGPHMAALYGSHAAFQELKVRRHTNSVNYVEEGQATSFSSC